METVTAIAETRVSAIRQRPPTRTGEIRTMDTVLVVEDSRAMQRTLQRLFEADSLMVQIASDGLVGLECFRKQIPCAVVLDLKLPGISGKELCREFKALAASVPIVVLSANSEVEDKVLLLELGADDYVTKPFSPKELLARVRRAMRRTASAQAAISPVTAKNVNHEVLMFGDARRKARHADGAGIQTAEVSGVVARTRDIARGIAE